MSISGIKRDLSDVQSPSSPFSKKSKLIRLDERVQLLSKSLFLDQLLPRIISLEESYCFSFDKSILLKEEIIKFDELLISKFFSEDYSCQIRYFVSQCLNHPYLSENEKIIEIGCLYFFLDRDGVLDLNCLSFFQKRLDELEFEASLLKKEFNDLSLSSNRIPEGVLNYLGIAFSHMIISAGGKVNLGGIYAIEKFLNETCLKTYFCETHLLQIKVVLSTLAKDQNFQKLLSENKTFHHSAALFLKLDLKSSKEMMLTSVDLHRGCLVAFFHFLRQSNKGSNCFVISYMQHLLLENPKNLYKTLLKLLENGTIGVDEHKIPFAPFFDDFLIYQKGVEEEYIDEKAKEFSILNFCLEGEGLPYPKDEKKLHSIQSLLPLNKNYSQDQVLSFRKRYSSFFYNHLQNILLFSFLFKTTNSTKNYPIISETDFNKYTIKRRLLAILLKNLNESFGNILTPDSFNAIYKKLINELWISNHYTLNIKANGNQLELGYEPEIQINTFKTEEELKKQKKILREKLSFYHLFEGKVVKLKTITELACYLKCALTNSIKTQYEIQNLSDQSISSVIELKPIKNALIKSLRELEISKNKKAKFSLEEMEENDQFLTQILGGSIEHIFQIEKTPYKKIKSTGTTLEETIKNLFYKLSNLNINSTLYFPCDSENHSFLFYHFQNKSILNGNVDYFFNNEIFEKSNKLIEKVNEDQKQRISCVLVFIDDEDLISIDEIEKLTSMREIHAYVSSLLSEEKMEDFNHEFLQILWNLDINILNFNQLLPSIKIDPNVFEKIRKNLISQNLNQVSITPFLIANQLIKQLHKINIFEHPSSLELEQKIIAQVDQPALIVFGDSNHLGNKNSILYIFRYDPFNKKFSLFERSGEHETMASQKDEKAFYDLTILLPQ